MLKEVITKLPDSRDQEFLEKGIALIEDTCYTMADIQAKQGYIERGNATVWGQYLNKWTNRQWALILFVMRELQNQRPEFFKPYHDEAIDKAEAKLHKHWTGENGRILDEKPNKSLAWRTLFSIYEIFNAIQDSILEDEANVNYQIMRKLFNV